jgi:hypothetical protein
LPARLGRTRTQPLWKAAYRVADVIDQREDFQQERLLARAPAEILGNRLDEIFAPGADGLQQGAQGADSRGQIGRALRKRRALCREQGRQAGWSDAGIGCARKCGL